MLRSDMCHSCSFAAEAVVVVEELGKHGPATTAALLGRAEGQFKELQPRRAEGFLVVAHGSQGC